MLSSDLAVVNLLATVGDPLFANGVDWVVVLITLVKAVIVLVFLLLSTAMVIWFERKLLGPFQNRIGPDVTGPWGILQSVADGIKGFAKEAFTPERADRKIYFLAPIIVALPAFLIFSVIPLSLAPITIAGRKVALQLADPPIGILFVLACSSIAVYGVMLAGWSSGSKYPLLGSVRATAQMISYEAALGLSVVGVVMMTGSLRTSAIVSAQAGNALSWNIIRMGVVPAVIFFISATAELNRPPFDLTEAESELVAGYQTEYGSTGFLLFYLAEYMNLVSWSFVISTLWLGGPNGPTSLFGWDFPGPDWMWGIFWLGVKVTALLFTFVWIRATLPRLRYDQLMDLGWKYLIPISLLWLLGLSAFRVLPGRSTVVIVIAVAIVVVSVTMVWGLLARAKRLGTETATEDYERHHAKLSVGKEH